MLPRDRLRMPPKDRNAYVSKNRENMDADMALAIVEMPAEFSDVLESDRAQLIDAALQAQHGEAMKELTELERAIEITESAIEAGRDEARRETGLSQHDFDERAAPFERKALGPKHWLKKSTEDGKEVISVIREKPTGIGNNVDVDEWRRANDSA